MRFESKHFLFFQNLLSSLRSATNQPARLPCMHLHFLYPMRLCCAIHDAGIARCMVCRNQSNDSKRLLEWVRLRPDRFCFFVVVSFVLPVWSHASGVCALSSGVCVHACLSVCDAMSMSITVDATTGPLSAATRLSVCPLDRAHPDTIRCLCHFNCQQHTLTLHSHRSSVALSIECAYACTVTDTATAAAPSHSIQSTGRRPLPVAAPSSIHPSRPS